MISRIDLAVHALDAGRPTEAFDLAVAVLKEDEEDLDGLYVAVRALLSLRQKKRAQQTIDRLVQLAPDDWRTHLARAWFLIRTNKRQEAYKVAYAGAELAPSSVEAMTAYARVASEVVGKVEAARAAARHSVELDPTSVMAHRVRGNIEARHQDWDEAISAYQSALELSPKDELTLAALARAYAHTGQKREARETSQRIVEENPDSVLLKDPESDMSPVDVYFGLRGLVAVGLLGFSGLVSIVVIKPVGFLSGAFLVVAGITFVPQLRGWVSTRWAPKAMAKAAGGQKWNQRNPDLVLGGSISIVLLGLLLFSVIAS